MFPHGVLGFIDVSYYRRQRTIIPDGAGQHIGYALLMAGINNAVGDVLVFQKRGDGAVEPNPVDGVQMVIVTVGLIFLGIDILSQGGFQVGGLQVMGRQRVACQYRVGVSVLNQLGKSAAGIVVKGEGRPITQTIFPCSFSWRRSWYSSS